MTATQRLRTMLTPIHEIEGTIVRCSAIPCPLAQTVALDLLNGSRYSVVWMPGEGCVYCRIETERGNAIVVAFDDIKHGQFLSDAYYAGSFTLVIEGMVPVEIETVRPRLS
jgi:hypothetical protein